MGAARGRNPAPSRRADRWLARPATTPGRPKPRAVPSLTDHLAARPAPMPQRGDFAVAGDHFLIALIRSRNSLRRRYRIPSATASIPAARGPGPPDARGPGPADARGPGPPDARGPGPADARGPGPPDARGPGPADARGRVLPMPAGPPGPPDARGPGPGRPFFELILVAGGRGRSHSGWRADPVAGGPGRSRSGVAPGLILGARLVGMRRPWQSDGLRPGLGWVAVIRRCGLAQCSAGPYW